MRQAERDEEVFRAIREWAEARADGVRCFRQEEEWLPVNAWGSYGSVVGRFFMVEESGLLCLQLDTGPSLPRESWKRVESYLERVNGSVTEPAVLVLDDEDGSVAAVTFFGPSDAPPGREELEAMLSRTWTLLDRFGRGLLEVAFGGRDPGEVPVLG